MKGTRRKLLVPTLLVAFVGMQALAETALADEDANKLKGWFFEMGVGTVRDRNDLAANIDTGGSPYMRRGYLGYAFTRYLGVMGGFGGTDPIKYTDSSTGNEDKISTKGVQAKVFASIPFHRDIDGFYAVTFTGGAWRWDAKATSSTNGSFHTTGFGPTASVGLIFAGRTSAIKFEYERFWLKPEVPAGDFTTSGDVTLKYDAFSVNFQFAL